MKYWLIDKRKQLLLAALLSVYATAQGHETIKQDWGEGTPDFANAEQLNNGKGQYDHWQSIGRVTTENGMTCSGSLIDTRQGPAELEGPAYLLTSGHCVSLDTNVTLEDVGITGQVKFNFFKDTAEQVKSYPITRINWSAIRGQDIAILQLDRTLGELLHDGITPLMLADDFPAEAAVLVVGAPMGSHVQRMACPMEHSAGILEGAWAWHDQVSNRCLDVVAGISGSPVLGRFSNEILAVVGTTTSSSGQARCSRGAPCEVVDGQVTKRVNTNYATKVTGLRACFSEGRFNAKNGSCSLGPAFNFAPDELGSWHIKVERDPSGHVIPWLWVQTFAVDRAFYRYKVTRTLDQCAVTHGYSEALASSNGGRNELRRELRDGAGIYLLCVMGQDQRSVDPQQWDARNARVYWRWMMEAPNPLAPIYMIEQSQADANLYSVRAFPVSPDLDAYSYQYKTGAVDNTDCLEPEGYKKVQPSLGIFEVEVKGRRLKVCLKTNDLAGNPSPVSEFQLPE